MKTENLSSEPVTDNGVNTVLAPVIDFNYRWHDAPIEMKELFAKEHNKNINDYIHEYDLMNMWYAKRYWLGIDS